MAANLDLAGDSLSAQIPTAAGITPGSTVTHDGLDFTWPNAALGDADNTIAQGQTIKVTGTGTKLGFLGFSVNGGSSGNGTITCTDGTTQSYNLSLGDWFWNSGDTLVSVPHINNAGAGQEFYKVSIYAATVTLQTGKTVASVTLPNATSGRTTMHIFSTAIG